MNLAPEVKTDLVNRLKRLQGQVRGVEKMVEGDRECREILQQLAAIRAAAHQASIVLIREHAAACLLKGDESASPQEVLDSLVSVLEKV
ncbi:MAG TPA: metal-sensitive transcriptional regulator [Anaerolineae bacterium]|nr:metal-sensitive transcriptional regulator [Anaerolineae bacterium]